MQIRVLQPDGFDVVPKHLARTAIGLDEGDGAGSARERLKPDRTAAGEQVEHPRARHVEQPAQRVEQRLARPVGRRPGAAGRDGEPAPLGHAADDRASCLLQILGLLGGDQGGHLRREQGMPVQLRIGRDQVGRLVPRRDDQVLVAQQRQQPQLRPAAGLRDAEHVTLAALLDVQAGELETVGRRRDRVEPLTRRRSGGACSSRAGTCPASLPRPIRPRS